MLHTVNDVVTAPQCYGMVHMVWYGTYGMVHMEWYIWYGTYGMVWYGMVWYGMVWRYHAVSTHQLQFVPNLSQFLVLPLKLLLHFTLSLLSQHVWLQIAHHYTYIHYSGTSHCTEDTSLIWTLSCVPIVILNNYPRIKETSNNVGPNCVHNVAGSFVVKAGFSTIFVLFLLYIVHMAQGNCLKIHM